MQIPILYMMTVSIDILYVENCPNYTKACSTICDIIAELDLDAAINISKVENTENNNHFRGSPTVLINGKDVELCYNEANELENSSEVVETVACRLYNCEHGSGCPSHEMVRCTVEEVVDSYY